MDRTGSRSALRRAIRRRFHRLRYSSGSNRRGRRKIIGSGETDRTPWKCIVPAHYSSTAVIGRRLLCAPSVDVVDHAAREPFLRPDTELAEPPLYEGEQRGRFFVTGHVLCNGKRNRSNVVMPVPSKIVGICPPRAAIPVPARRLTMHRYP